MYCWATRAQRKRSIVSSYTKVNNTILAYNNLSENNRFHIVDIKQLTDHGERCEDYYTMERGHEEPSWEPVGIVYVMEVRKRAAATTPPSPPSGKVCPLLPLSPHPTTRNETFEHTQVGYIRVCIRILTLGNHRLRDMGSGSPQTHNDHSRTSQRRESKLRVLNQRKPETR